MSMSEDVYVNTGPDLTKKVRSGRGERQMEMEERGEIEEDIYLNPDDLDHIYETADNLDPGTKQDAAQNNTAQEQHGGSDQSKNNHSRAVGVCLVVVWSLLLVVIIGLVIKYSEKITEKNNLVKDLEQLQFRYNNMTKQKDQIQSNYNNLTEERDDLKRRLCESCGFTFDGGVCYYVSTKKKTWDVSRRYCKDRQSDLMVVNSKEKQDLVKRVTGRDANVWLGLIDREKEGVWMWVDGTTLTTPTYWAPGEPDNKFEQEVEDVDCAVLWNGGLKGWHDNPCSQNNNWICERVLC